MSDVKEMIATGEANYNGMLRYHLKTVCILWCSGKSPREIGWHLLSVDKFRHPYGYDERALSGLISFVLKRCGAVPRTSPYQWQPVNLRRWENVLPSNIAKKQNSWDRQTTVVRMRELGMKSKEICDKLGISRARMHQLYTLGKNHSEKSPAEKFLEQENVFAAGPLTMRAIYRLSRQTVDEYEQGHA